MIKIDSDKCNLCGLCTKICHESCLHIDNDILTIDYKYCSTCTQCIAICPQLALTWNDFQPEKFDKSLFPDIKHVRELLMERRTIRDYTDKKIEKSILQEITDYAIYAPTHNFNLRAIIIDDEEIIKEVDSLIFKFSVNIYKWLYKPRIILTLIKLFVPKSEFEYLKAKPKLEKVKKRAHGFKTKPAAIILIIGEKRVPLSLESAQYALYNIDLYGQTKGLACRNLVGNQMILNRNKKFKKLIGLNKSEKIFGAITLGYAAIKFKNKVIGKKINIQWNSIKN
ncbi:nitroreductase family protein [bacterium]|nr:nitroreductase family protein [bacterium]MBU1064241.1 nitroreductase family protein [bacterium]MBU1634006.1 nitroreductase family protein [bacterium]MBU1874236.1 nitroreductase family protein [bacterium]